MTIDIIMGQKEKKTTQQEPFKFEGIRPFGPTIIKGKMPMDLIHLLDKKASQMLGNEQLSKEFNHAQNLAGNVKKEVRYPQSWMSTKEFKPVVHYMGEMVKAYISIPPASETISPEFVGKLLIESMWMVSQWAGDFNPFHIHEGQLSGVIYLRIPPGLKQEYSEEDHYPTVGDIVFFHGQAATFSGHKMQHTPKVGDIFLFPNWLSHGVYPFRTKGQERRSVSFNLQLVRKEGDPGRGNAETKRNKDFYSNQNKETHLIHG
jgi:uncharacterized protein (TIGR02466 family)|tara:strand:- start:3162 stop:3944 length:783 start_codon:yes stop_codon:yes gene_type:complete